MKKEGGVLINRNTGSSIPLINSYFSPGANNSFTEGFTSTIIVSTPRTVPNGINMHSSPAIIRQNV